MIVVLTGHELADLAERDTVYRYCYRCITNWNNWVVSTHRCDVCLNSMCDVHATLKNCLDCSENEYKARYKDDSKQMEKREAKFKAMIDRAVANKRVWRIT